MCYHSRVNLGVMAIKGYSTFPKSSSITDASPSDSLVSYSGHSLGKSYPFAFCSSCWLGQKVFFKEFLGVLLEKKLDGNYTRMLRAILNKSWRQYPTRHQLYGHLPPIAKTIMLDESDMQDTAGEAGTSS